MTPRELYRYRKERQVVVVNGVRTIVSAPEVRSMWVGGVTGTAASVVATLSDTSSAVRLVVSESREFTSPMYSSPVASSNNAAKMSIAGLTQNRRYFYGVEASGRLSELIGTFRTLPAAANASFRIAMSGDAFNGSNMPVFDQIREQAPLFFIHMGDLFYGDITSNNEALYRAQYDTVLAAPRQAQLYRDVATVYVWDNHDYGAPDSNGSSVTKAAAAAVYRQRVPHHSLVDGTGIYHSFSVGRVLFIVTDLRAFASAMSATDNSSKTVLGTTQKTWMKNLIQANPGKLIVWVCSRVFGGVPTSNVDHWGAFTTERTEMADFFKVNCPGRICVLSADMHSLAIDDGTNHDFATGGGCPIPTFQAAPLDRTAAQDWGGATYSEGGRYTTNSQFGVMEVTDRGGNELIVDWTGYGADGARLVTYRFTVDLS